MRYLQLFFLMLFLSLAPAIAAAGEAVLSIETSEGTSTFTATQLLERRDRTSITIEPDPSYKQPMTYAAVPVLSLIPDRLFKDFDTLEARATDGFVSQLPLALFKRAGSGGSVPWLAIEDPKAPWPKLPDKSVSAGPFYVIWLNPERSNVGPEQWPYALSALKLVLSPAKRWPQMAVADDVPKDAREHRGLSSFIKHCLACHRIKGAGEAEVGPDLAEPMAPTVYLSPLGLRLLIRNPASVRTWPDQKMPGFSREALPDGELEDLISYLAYVAKRRAGP